MRMPEQPVALTVSRIRQELYLAAGASTSERGGGALVGTLFHQAAAAILDSDSACYWERVLVGGHLDGAVLAQRAYEVVVGPGLSRYRSSLQGTGEQALALWKAAQSFCAWFCGLVETALKSGQLKYDAVREQWTGGTALFQAEVTLTTTLSEAGWAGPVSITGRADQLIRAGGRYCIVEFKLGAGHAEADMLQACLYREMLPAGSSIAVVRFAGTGGGVEETVVSAEQAAGARQAVMDLIEALAFGGASAPSIPVNWPKPAGPEEIELGKKLIAAFREFGAEVRMAGEPLVGPAFVRFFIEAGRRATAKRILQQGINLQMRLQLSAEPMIHLTEGRIAVDVQRATREPIPFAHVREMLRAYGGESRVLAGMDLAGHPHFADFAAPEHAHMLVAGVAGSGKTEWLRSAIASLMVQNTADTLRLVLIDPKRNAFPELRKSPFLWRADAFLCPPEDDVVAMLEALVTEMEERYLRFEMERADDLAEYLRNGGAALPRIVCVCDEFGDLLMGSKAIREDIENAVNRLGQKARAAGIHLVLATQRPSRQVVSGVLKANLPCRVALKVTEALESRIILDRNGAENLLGRGDLLFSGGGEPVRLQAPLLDADDRRLVFEFGGAVRAG